MQARILPGENRNMPALRWYENDSGRIMVSNRPRDAADILRGVPSAYCDLVGYDEVAHHSDLVAPESIATLRRTDDQLRPVPRTLESAPRPYFVVVLSDHGQERGATFEQRYGDALDEFVGEPARRGRIDAPALAAVGWHNVNGMLTDVVADDSRLGRTVAWAARGRTVVGEVQLGPVEQEIDDADGDAAFEALIGLHGGLGGKQSQPFVPVPDGLEPGRT